MLDTRHPYNNIGNVDMSSDSQEEYRRLIGNRLKAARKRTKLTQGQVGELLGFSQNTISDGERGKHGVSPMTIAAMARLYGISVESVLDPDEAAVMRTAPTSDIDDVDFTTSPPLNELTGDENRIVANDKDQWMAIAARLADAVARAEETLAKVEDTRQLELQLNHDVAMRRIQEVEAPQARARELEQQRLKTESEQLGRDRERLLQLVIDHVEGDLPHRARSKVTPEQATGR